MQMRRVTGLAVVTAMFLQASALTAAGIRGQGETSSLSGRATDAKGQTLSGARVQLRNVQTGQIASTTTASAEGDFTFAGVPGGTYTAEVVDASGAIMGTSAAIILTAGRSVTGLMLSSRAGARQASTSGAGLSLTTAAVVASVAAAAGITGIIVAKNRSNSSPSK